MPVVIAILAYYIGRTVLRTVLKTKVSQALMSQKILIYIFGSLTIASAIFSVLLALIVAIDELSGGKLKSITSLYSNELVIFLLPFFAAIFAAGFAVLTAILGDKYVSRPQKGKSVG